MVLDDLRNYLQMASGLTEATTSKAKDVVGSLLSQGLSLSSKAMPAPEMMGQVQELADDLVTTSRNNREMLVGMIRGSTCRADGLRPEIRGAARHVQRLEKQINDLEAASRPSSTTWPAGAAPTAAPTVSAPEPTVADVPADSGEVDAPVKKKKKKILVEPQDGAPTS
jgi:polyhydroxyalkanoate synthesis regulator phasin